MVIDIVMTTWNRSPFTNRSLKSIHANTLYPHRIIVVDNGSDEGSVGILQEFKKLGLIDILVLLDKNYGLEYAKTLGMNFVESELFVSTDNDILAPKIKDGQDWLGGMVDLMEKYPDYGAITARPQILVGTGDIFTDGDITDFNHIPGYLRIMRTQPVKEVGSWNENRPLRGHEEYLISQRLNAAGWKTGWSNNIKCFHMFGENDDWGYYSMKPEDHGHNPTSLPKDSQFDRSDYE